MTTYAARIPIGIGNLIYHRAQMDAVRDRFDCIEVGFRWEFLHCRTEGHRPFVLDLARVLFLDSPYVIAPHSQAKATNNYGIWQEDHILPQKPWLPHLLCAGESLALDRPYLLLMTKVRDLHRKQYEEMRPRFYQALRTLSDRYDLVLTGEREVEYNEEYAVHGADNVYSIYQDMKDELPLVDLTVPRLGLTVPNLSKLRQDCTYMRDAHRCITIGLSGLFCVITAVGETLGWRTDPNPVFNYLYNQGPVAHANVLRNADEFLHLLSEL